MAAIYADFAVQSIVGPAAQGRRVHIGVPDERGRAREGTKLVGGAGRYLNGLKFVQIFWNQRAKNRDCHVI